MWHTYLPQPPPPVLDYPLDDLPSLRNLEKDTYLLPSTLETLTITCPHVHRRPPPFRTASPCGYQGEYRQRSIHLHQHYTKPQPPGAPRNTWSEAQTDSRRERNYIPMYDMRRNAIYDNTRRSPCGTLPSTFQEDLVLSRGRREQNKRIARQVLGRCRAVVGRAYRCGRKGGVVRLHQRPSNRKWQI